MGLDIVLPDPTSLSYIQQVSSRCVVPRPVDIVVGEGMPLSLSRVSFRVSLYRVSLMFPWEHKGNGPRDI